VTAPAGASAGLDLRERAIAGALVLGFAPALIGLAAVWSSVDYLSHGFLIPVVALWVAMRERPRRAHLARDPRPLAVIAILGSIALYLAGLASGALSLQALAGVATVAAAVLWLRGPAWLAALAFPIGYLVFMIPPPAGWITPLIVRLQVLVSTAAVSLLHGFGFPILRDGNVLILPSGLSLFVAEACSGITSIVTLAPLGVLLAYLQLRGTWQRAVLVLSVVPLAMAGNLVRVVATVLLAERFGAEGVTDGPVHVMLGLLVYVG
jgi:exosortase